jgi:hypothetical protein
MAELLQKALLPAQSGAILLGGWDQLAGFVVRAADVAWARTPAELIEAHGLGFAGSPLGDSSEHIDVLRFLPSPTMQLITATGGTDAATRARTAGPFVDRAPFTGTGFVHAPGHVIPLWWLVPARMAPGTELVRIDRSGSAVVLARYGDVGTGWVDDSALQAVGPRPRRISRHVGTLASMGPRHVPADLLPGSAGIALAEPDAVTPGAVRRRVVTSAEVDELFEIEMTGSWNGLKLRIIDEWNDENGVATVRCSSLENNADLAEALGLVKVDAAVYEFIAPKSALENLVAMKREVPLHAR